MGKREEDVQAAKQMAHDAVRGSGDLYYHATKAYNNYTGKSARKNAELWRAQDRLRDVNDEAVAIRDNVDRQGYRDVHDKLARKEPTHKD